MIPDSFRSERRLIASAPAMARVQWGIVLLLFLIATLPVRAQLSREYQLKAVFLFNFAQFTEWPTNNLTNDAPLVIGVLGIDPFGEALDNTVRGEAVGGRKLTVERYREVGEIERCHILFVSRSESRRLERIGERLAGRPILIVSDVQNAAARGAMIQFVTENNRIRMRINTNQVSEAHLTLSSKLLRAAEIVSTEPTP